MLDNCKGYCFREKKPASSGHLLTSYGQLLWTWSLITFVSNSKQTISFELIINFCRVKVNQKTGDYCDGSFVFLAKKKKQMTTIHVATYDQIVVNEYTSKFILAISKFLLKLSLISLDWT